MAINSPAALSVSLDTLLTAARSAIDQMEMPRRACPPRCRWRPGGAGGSRGRLGPSRCTPRTLPKVTVVARMPEAPCLRDMHTHMTYLWVVRAPNSQQQGARPYSMCDMWLVAPSPRVTCRHTSQYHRTQHSMLVYRGWVLTLAVTQQPARVRVSSTAWTATRCSTIITKWGLHLGLECTCW